MMQPMPSSPNRRRVEIPAYLFARVQQIADAEQRTVASVVHEILLPGIHNYQPAWLPGDREKLSTRAARVLERTEGDVPRRFNHNYVGTEHLLLALAEADGGVAPHVLQDLGVDAAAVSGRLVAIIGRGDQPPRGQPDYAPRVRKVLGIALREASNLDHGFVGTGHLLLAIVREGQGIATGILQRMGVGLDTVAERVTQALARGEYPLSEG
jgi:ATP-dependent Clp protease ATP-binding subunit ClpC